MGILYVALASFGGGVVAGLLGWLHTGEDFIARKFAATVIRALVAGGAFAIAYTVTSGSVTVEDLIVAFLAGAGADSIMHKLAK